MRRPRELDDLDVLAQTGFNVYRLCQDGKAANGDQIAEWGDLPNLSVSCWLAIAEAAKEILQDAENLPWIRFAEMLYEFGSMPLTSRGYTIPEFSSLDDQTRRAYVIVARHLANVMTMDVDDQLADHEGRWTCKALQASLVTQ